MLLFLKVLFASFDVGNNEGLVMKVMIISQDIEGGILEHRTK